MRLLLSCGALLVAFTLAAVGQQLAKDSATPKPPLAAPHKNVTPDDAEKLLKSVKDLVILDVRTPEEFSAGHIAGATNASILEADFEKKLKQAEGKPVLLHCASGTRSARALPKMRDLRFPEIYHMDGGMKAWESAGKPVVKGSAETK